MPFNYQKVLVIGATSGIGEALAARIVEHGSRVIVVGRRKENLDAFVKKHGSDRAEPIVFDITKLQDIPNFAHSITSQHPDLDCIILNSGIQRGIDFSKPESVDLSVVSEEFTTNYLSYIDLTNAFLPHLQKSDKETSLIYMSSGLALVPIARCANYCASKAALHQWLLCLRHQVSKGLGNIKVIEVFPPAVQTELHDEKHQPDLKDGGSVGMPLKEFTDEAWAGLEEGKDQIPVGIAAKFFDGFEQDRQNAFQMFVKMTEK